MRSIFFFCAGALWLGVSCASPLPPAEPSPRAKVTGESGAAEAASSAEPSRDDRKDAELQAKLSEALAYVSQVRQLAATGEVKGRSLSRQDIERYIHQQLAENTPEDAIRATEALLYGFGAVDADFDYRGAVISLMSAQLLGFYDPQRKTFFVSGELTGDEADATLWHELVHALQDQHYDLSGITQWQPDHGDRLAAAHALAEGDATSTMLDALFRGRSTALELPEGLLRAESVLGSAALSAPPILVRSLLAPYVDGLAFANQLRRRGGFAAVDAAWRNLPASTEQLLHPEKYFAGEAPLSVPLPPPPPHQPQLEQRFHDVMGEQTLRLLLEEWLPARTAREAASDWGGDRLAAFSDEARQRWAIGWHVRFDSVPAAERALAAFARSLELTERRPESQRAELPPPGKVKGDRVCRARHTQGPIALVRRGPDLGVTVGPLQRTGVAVAVDPDCAAALTWATKIANN